MTPIYITGYGIISAIGIGKSETKASLLDKTSGVGAVQILQTTHTSLPVGEVRLTNEELATHLGLEYCAPMNRTALLGAIALREALIDAGISVEDTENTPFISGTTVGGMDQTERVFGDVLAGGGELAPLKAHGCGDTSVLTAKIAGLMGKKVVTISTACSSAANALIYGANMIRTGQADMVIAGGAEALSRFHLNGFNTLMILDKDVCRPFDATRRGLNLGEGAAYVILESERSARRRGVAPKYVLSGYGNACDAFHQTATSDNGEGAFLAMTEALRLANLSAEDINYVNAHGTGTPNNDVCEGVALKRVFGDHLPPVSSTKSFTGHTTSASGSIETVISLLAMEHGFIPANLGWANPIEDGIIPTLGKSNAQLDHVMCNSFGFGGNDSCLILSRAASCEALHESSAEQSAAMPRIFVKAESRVQPGDDLSGLKAYVSPMESRRMCRLLKSSLLSTMNALTEASVSVPGAIITATCNGMLENSEKFLLDICNNGEEALSPTLFMQSTHNTIGGALAIRTKCHGYNITYTPTHSSLRDCIDDALMLFRLTDVDNVLIGYHDEATERFSEIHERLYGTPLVAGQTSISLLLSRNAEGALYELTPQQIESLCGA